MSLYKHLFVNIIFIMLTMFILILPAYAEDAPVPISSAEELAAISSDPYGSYILTSDINMAGIEWVPVEFHGRLDGGGYAIYNLNVTAVGAETELTYDGNLKEYSNVFSGLFSVLSGAEITGLNIVDAYINVSPDTHCFTGLLAGYAVNTTVSSCSLSGRVRLENHAVNSGIGGVIGYGSCTVNDCTVDCELVFLDRFSEGKCEQFMGGILGCGRCSIDSCTVNLQGYISCSGYVHSGGLVGMHYECRLPSCGDRIQSSYVAGSIHFFENNRDRRAYCSAYVGETLTAASQYKCRSDFTRDETWDYSADLLPEKCADPDIVDIITANTCTDWGFTTHTCSICGYSYRDTYTAPAHEPDDYIIELEPDYVNKGKAVSYCKNCGELVDIIELPVLLHPMECSFEQSSVTIGRHASFVLSPVLEYCTADDLIWTSSDTSVAVVDETGCVTATGRGTAVISCSTSDGNSSASCSVEVTGFLSGLLRSIFG